MSLKDYYNDFNDFLNDYTEDEFDFEPEEGFEDFLGDLMTVDEFIDCVESGLFIDYDGIGHFSDEEGNEEEEVYCDVDWLKAHRGSYTHVMWYNR